MFSPVRLFERQLPRCTSVNRFNRLSISLENKITPKEVEAIAALIESRDTLPAAVEWVAKLRNSMRLSGKRTPEPFLRTRLRPNIYLYSAGGPAEGKTLIVGFTGAAGRLFMPISTFLQHLDASRVDLLLVYRHGQRRYFDGLPGLARSFPALVGVLREVTDSMGHGRRVTLGASVGGLPALLTAIYLGFDRGVSSGALAMSRDRWGDVIVDAFFRRAIGSWSGAPQLLNLYSARNRRDREAAYSLRDCLPLATWQVPWSNAHNSLHPYLVSGCLAEVLDRQLMADWPPVQWPAWTRHLVSKRSRVNDARYPGSVSEVQSALDRLRLRMTMAQLLSGTRIRFRTLGMTYARLMRSVPYLRRLE
jgi:hypothetical protein